MNTSKTNPINYGFAAIAALFVFGVFTGSVHAQWQNLGNGIWRDNNNLEWKNFNTVTGSLQAAEQTVAKQGFRLPTHSEYRSLEGNGGINRLGIPTDSYTRGAVWEATGGLVHGWGGNLKSLFPSNHNFLESRHRVIGVRNAVIDGGGGGWDEPPATDFDGGDGGSPTDDPTFYSIGQNNNSVNYRLVLVTLQSDESGTAQSQQVNVKRIRETLNSFKGKGTHHTLHTSSNNKTVGNQFILNYIKNKVSVGSNDVLFFFYGGHGGCVENTKNQFWGIESPDRESQTLLNRADVRNALKAKGARLTILISDCCSSIFAQNDPAEQFQYKVIGGNNLEQLFSVRGLVDITSSDFRQFSIGNSADGGFFTRSFCGALRSQSTWQGVYNSARTGTENLYRVSRDKSDRNSKIWQECYSNQTTQTPWIITPPLP